MTTKFLAALLLTVASAFAEAPSQTEGQSVQLKNINLDSIFKTTHGADTRLGFDIKEDEKKTFETEDSGHTYGEMTVDGIKRLLIYTISKFNLDPSKVKLLDIGSGTGRVCMGSCALANFEKCDGVELSPSRFNISQKALQKCLTEYDKVLKPGQITFTNMNALKYEMKKYNLIWISSLCFPESFQEKLRQKLEKELESGSVILTSQAFVLPENSRLELIETTTIPMTWKTEGSTTRVYRVKDAAKSLKPKTTAAA